jgi:hypothetical protein
MFNSYEMTRALVSERHDTLRHEARQRRLTRGFRRSRRSTPEDTSPFGEQIAA